MSLIHWTTIERILDAAGESESAKAEVKKQFDQSDDKDKAGLLFRITTRARTHKKAPSTKVTAIPNTL